MEQAKKEEEKNISNIIMPGMEKKENNVRKPVIMEMQA